MSVVADPGPDREWGGSIRTFRAALAFSHMARVRSMLATGGGGGSVLENQALASLAA
jgi:hypothetical protein